MSKRKNDGELLGEDAKKREIDEQEEDIGMKLVDLDDDCLEEIFTPLARNDLINVAAANSRFRGVAQRIYKRDHGTNFELTTENSNKHNLRVLRHFGEILKSIIMKVDLNKFNSQLLDEIIKHSTESLQNLDISFVDTPIEKEVRRRNWWSFLRNLGTNFPDLVSLRLNCGRVGDFRDLKPFVQRFPALLSLRSTVYAASIRTLKKIIKLNPQLQSVVLDFPEPTPEETDVDEFIRVVDKSTKLSARASDNVLANDKELQDMDVHLMFRELLLVCFFDRNLDGVEWKVMNTNGATWEIKKQQVQTEN